METDSSTSNSVLPVVAIFGRPNVGKSSLFNRILRRRRALVDSTPGLTRDRLYGDVRWGGLSFRVVDTGGLVFPQKGRKNAMEEAIASQVARAMEEAAVALFVCDGRAGLLPLDRQVASWLRPWGKQVLVVVNKVDADTSALGVHEFSALGLGSARPVSGLHGLGVGNLLDAVVEQLRAGSKGAAGEKGGDLSDSLPTIRVALVGRPNVGKSSLLNRLLNEERVLVDEKPGTTRDPVEAALSYNGRRYLLTDTAGVRARRTLKSRMDAVARLKTMEVIRRAQVCVGILEAQTGIVGDDLKLLDQVVSAHRPLCLLLNKWDLLSPSQQAVSAEEAAAQVGRRAPFLRFAPVVCVSAKTGFQTLQVLDRIREVADASAGRLTSGQTRQILDRIRKDPRSPAGLKYGRLIRLHQVGVCPPAFHLLAARLQRPLRRSDLTFLEELLRREGGFVGSPVRLRLLAMGNSRR